MRCSVFTPFHNMAQRRTTPEAVGASWVKVDLNVNYGAQSALLDASGNPVVLLSTADSVNP